MTKFVVLCLCWQAEGLFLQVQEDRRSIQQELTAIQAEVRTLGAELEKTNRTDYKYIDLVKKEHEVLLVEKNLSNQIKTLEKAERDYFSLLSAAVRESHEKERSRAEKTKYWSIIGSVIGAMIGIIGSTVNNHRRMTQLRAIIAESNESTAEYKAMMDKLFQSVSENKNVQTFPLLQNADVNSDTPHQHYPHTNSEVIENQTKEILQTIEKQSSAVITQLSKMEEAFGLQQAVDREGNVVYVGPDMRTLLNVTEERLQTSQKKNAMVTTAAISGIVAATCVIVSFFKGSLWLQYEYRSYVFVTTEYCL